MKVVKVQYTVQASYADENAKNIRKVMDALKASPIDGVTYFAYREDGNTFVHIVLARDEAAQNKIPEIAEFKAFQTALRSSNPVSPPKQEFLNMVGASFG